MRRFVTGCKILRAGFRSAKAALNSLSVSSLRIMRSTRIWVCEMILVSFLISASSLAKIVARSMFFAFRAFEQVLKRAMSLWCNLTMTCPSLNRWVLSFGTASKITSSSVRGGRKGFLMLIPPQALVIMNSACSGSSRGQQLVVLGDLEKLEKQE